MTTVLDSTLILVVGIWGTSINVSETNEKTNNKLNCLHVHAYSLQEENRNDIVMLVKDFNLLVISFISFINIYMFQYLFR